jgi:hypothetical protein
MMIKKIFMDQLKDQYMSQQKGKECPLLIKIYTGGFSSLEKYATTENFPVILFDETS